MYKQSELKPYLGTRTANALAREGIYTLSELKEAWPDIQERYKNYPGDSTQTIRNLGLVGYQIIENFLAFEAP